MDKNVDNNISLIINYKKQDTKQKHFWNSGITVIKNVYSNVLKVFQEYPLLLSE